MEVALKTNCFQEIPIDEEYLINGGGPYTLAGSVLAMGLAPTLAVSGLAFAGVGALGMAIAGYYFFQKNI